MTLSAPASTYRLQISRDFTLSEAAELLDYLVELGAGAVYLSPLLRSTTGSTHGYDTVVFQGDIEATGGFAERTSRDHSRTISFRAWDY